MRNTPLTYLFIGRHLLNKQIAYSKAIILCCTVKLQAKAFWPGSYEHNRMRSLPLLSAAPCASLKLFLRAKVSLKTKLDLEWLREEQLELSLPLPPLLPSPASPPLAFPIWASNAKKSGNARYWNWKEELLPPPLILSSTEESSGVRGAEEQEPCLQVPSFVNQMDS